MSSPGHTSRWIRRVLPISVVAAALAGAALPAGVSARTSPQPSVASLKSGALATFDVGGERFRAWVTNPNTVKDLVALRAGTSTATIPNGRLLPGPGNAGHNKPWHWHLDPKDIQMADVTTEVCDGAPSYVEAHLDDFMAATGRYCPWSASLVALKLLPGATKPPAAPSHLRISGVTPGTGSAKQTTVTLRWDDNAHNETGFRIRAVFSRLYGGTDSRTTTVSANSVRTRFTFVAGGFNPVRKACFTVAAFNGGGESPVSNTVCTQF